MVKKAATKPRLVAKIRLSEDDEERAALARVRALFARPDMSVEALRARAEELRKWEEETSFKGGAYVGILR